ncbi:MAG TPA: dipeptide/oligopeptide/nickel ABC transporter permease/ATP-binding protein, partial [Rugosimonospora sp.]|nr:dipeptide/oligopeptide/nickel ABC transporter permease/ATP-binding protein [Rugosimonospora sp.]
MTATLSPHTAPDSASASAGLGAPAPTRDTPAGRHRLATVAGAYLTILVLAAALAPAIAPTRPQTQDLRHVLAGPSGRHWLGSDRLGRDVLTRLLFGARVTLVDVAVAAVVFLALGAPLGILAGYRRGWLDRIVVRVADVLLSVPAIVVLFMVVAVFPGRDLATMVALGVIGCPTVLRIARGATMTVRSELFVTAARLSGLGTPAVLRRHVLPRIRGPVIVSTSLFCATALLAESGLSFLGLTRPESAGPSWGNMVGEAASVLSQDPWLLIPTGGAVAVTVMAFGLLGDGIRDATAGRVLRTVPLLDRTRPRPTSPPGGDEPGGAALSVRGLTVTLDSGAGPVTVLRDVGFDVAPGEAVGLIGESGSGKSVTARAVLGLLPPGGAIAAGRVCLGGRELTGLTDRELGRVRGSGVALISQDPANSLDPTFTVGSQLVEVIRRHQRLDRRSARAEAVRLLRMVRLPHPERVLRQRSRELSGGMAQRVCIALALAGRPALLIADEPTTALDVTVQAEILALLRDLRERLGMALLLITHDWGVLADAADRAVVLYAGEVVETATVA